MDNGMDNVIINQFIKGELDRHYKQLQNKVEEDLTHIEEKLNSYLENRLSEVSPYLYSSHSVNENNIFLHLKEEMTQFTGALEKQICRYKKLNQNLLNENANLRQSVKKLIEQNTKLTKGDD